MIPGRFERFAQAVPRVGGCGPALGGEGEDSHRVDGVAALKEAVADADEHVGAREAAAFCGAHDGNGVGGATGLDELQDSLVVFERCEKRRECRRGECAGRADLLERRTER